jgi:hypothetical protein
MPDCPSDNLDGRFQVIDRITVNAALAARYPEGLLEGLWVILAPEETRDTPVPTSGRVVNIEKPDGSVNQVTLDGADIRRGVMALHFLHLDKDDIPRLSRVWW